MPRREDSLHVHAYDRGEVEGKCGLPQFVRLIRDEVAEQRSSGTHLLSACINVKPKAHSKRCVYIDPAAHLEQTEAHPSHAMVEFFVRKIHTLLVHECRITLAHGPFANCALPTRQLDRRDVVQRCGVLELLRGEEHKLRGGVGRACLLACQTALGNLQNSSTALVSLFGAQVLSTTSCGRNCSRTDH